MTEKEIDHDSVARRGRRQPRPACGRGRAATDRARGEAAGRSENVGPSRQLRRRGERTATKTCWRGLGHPQPHRAGIW